MQIRIPLTVATIMAISGCSSMNTGMQPFSQASLPDAVKVPAGHVVAMETVGAGDITYECRAKQAMAGQFEWCSWVRTPG